MGVLRGICDSILEYREGKSRWSWEVVDESCFATTVTNT